jgi:hypothetical protein
MKSLSSFVAMLTLIAFNFCVEPISAQVISPRPRKTDPKEKEKSNEKPNPAIDNELEVRYGAEHVTTQILGVKIRAAAGAVKDAYGTIPIPTAWPEQPIRIVKEEISPAVRTSDYRNIGLVKQYRFHMPTIDISKEESVIFTVEYTRRDVLAPEDTSAFVIPKKLDKELKIYLSDSPKLDPKSPKVTATLKEIFSSLEESATDWEKVEAIFKWVKENVSRHMAAAESAADVLKTKKGNSEDIVATFVALARAAKVPTRIVWLSEGCSAEFYLQDDTGKGRWFPCSYGAQSEFGFSTESRPIMQKGDSFRLPKDVFQADLKGEIRQVVETLRTAAATPGAGAPKVDFLRQMVAAPTKGGPGQPATPAMEKKPGEAFIPIPGTGKPTTPPGGLAPANPLPGKAPPAGAAPK